ncbi:alpha/beta hydrolase [Pseudomonadota bacterium]
MSDTVTCSWINPTGVVPSSFFSRVVDSEVGYNIMLPPEYSVSSKRFPVIYFLHGIAENENSMPYPYVAAQIYDAISNGEIPPIIAVFVNDGNGYSFYANSPTHNIPVETIIITELIPHIDKTYRTIPERIARGICGFSMGGFGALSYSMRHTHLFGSVVAYASGFVSLGKEEGEWRLIGGSDPQPDAKIRKQIAEVMFDNNPDIFEQYDPQSLLIKHIERLRKELPVRLVVGKNCGTISYHNNFSKLMEENDYQHDYVKVEGVGHNFGELFKEVGIEGIKFHIRAMNIG